MMFITGGRPQGARVESHDDHRIAMAVAVASLGLQEKYLSEIHNVLQNHIRISLMISDSLEPWFMNNLQNS